MGRGPLAPARGRALIRPAAGREIGFTLLHGGLQMVHWFCELDRGLDVAPGKIRWAPSDVTASPNESPCTRVHQ
jgi:hypothetical protein